MSKIYAMSDIHGCYDEFLEALDRIDLSQKENELVLLGDYIDNGPKSFQVLSKVMKLESQYPRLSLYWVTMKSGFMSVLFWKSQLLQFSGKRFKVS